MFKLIATIIVCLSSTMTYSAYAEATSGKFSLGTSSFSPKGSMPATYTCDGKNISPELAWAHVPDKTQSFSIIMSDLDAPGGDFYHWVAYNIPATVSAFPEGMINLPSGAMAGLNSWHKMEYNGPCPPAGKTHRYIFTLYALDNKIDLPDGADAKTITNAMQNHILGQAELGTVYTKQ